MKRILAILFLIAVVVMPYGCEVLSLEIDSEKVNVSDATKIFTYKASGEKVTGKVIFYAVDPRTGKRYKESFREVANGKRINLGYDYYPSGELYATYSFNGNGLINGPVSYLYPNGKLWVVGTFRDDKWDGIVKEYSTSGIPSKEAIYEDGEMVKEYSFDEAGNKIIPAIEKLKLIGIKTGFKDYYDPATRSTIYQPIVIMKWKNIADQAIDEDIEIEGLFISKNEELSKESVHFQWKGDTPLQSGMARQTFLQSNVGYLSGSGVYQSDIYCQIFINKQAYRTTAISKTFLESNRIQ